MGRLGGKVAIVTGGASGIGRAIATGFAGEGARVCIADMSAERCDAVARELGNGAFGQFLDVRHRKTIDTMVERVAAEAGGIDILVSCAGVFSFQLLTEITEEEFDRVFAVNSRGLLFTAQAVARRMIAQGRGGSIVNMASGAARRGTPGGGVYSASKAAVVSFTQTMALELISSGIRVNAIAPGGVKTPMWNEVDAAYGAATGSGPGGAEKMFNALTPVGRLSTPEELVGAAIFLAGPESAYVVGQTLNVDGGMFLS